MSITISELDIKDSWNVYLCSWKLIKPHFLVALLFCFVVFFGQILLSIIPFIGGFLSGFLSALLGAGIFHAANNWYQGLKIEIEDLFIAFNRRDLFQKLWPLGAISGFASFVTGNLGPALAPLGSDFSTLATILGTVIVVAISSIMYFAIALQIFEEVSLQESLELALRGMLKNWAPLLVSGMIFIALAVASVMTLFLGMLVLFPVSYFGGYFWYLGMYRGFSMESHLSPTSPEPMDPSVSGN